MGDHHGDHSAEAEHVSEETPSEASSPLTHLLEKIASSSLSTTLPPPEASSEAHPLHTAHLSHGEDSVLPLHAHDAHHDGGHEDAAHMENVMHSISQVKSPTTIEHLIHGLRSKLKTLSGGEVELLKDGDHDGGHSQDLTDEASSSHHNDTESAFGELDDAHHEPRDTFSVVFHPDTMILVTSCVVMIVVGLVLRKVFSYFTRMRKQRERYHGGLKQLADHMNVVTRTMSTDPNKTFAQDTPKVQPKLASAHSLPLRTISPMGEKARAEMASRAGGRQAETSLSMFDAALGSPGSRPSSGDVQSLSETRRALEARRLSKFQNYCANMDD